MAANFSKRTNNNDVKGSPFNKVIFGGDAAVMETELNELQDLIGRNMEILTKTIGTTFILRSHSYGGDEMRDRLSSTNTNGDLVFDTNGIDTYIVCNGGKYVISISDILFDEVESKDITDGCIYIKNVTYTKDDDGNIIYSGYKNGKLLNVYGVLGKGTGGKLNANIFDSRINQETTRREGFVWWFGEATETETYDVKVEGLTFDYLKKSTSNPYGSLVIKCPVISGNGLLSIINNMDYHNNKDQSSIGIGANTNKNGKWTNGPSYDSVAIGHNAVSDYGSHDSVVIGYNSHAGNYEANINAPNSVVIGSSSRSDGENSIVIGSGDSAENNSIAIGKNVCAINGIAIGSLYKLNDVESEPIVIGGVSRYSSSLAIGYRVGSNFMVGSNQLPVIRTMLIGSYARPVPNVANGIATNVMAIGHLASGNNESITIGVNAISGVNSVSIGHNANAVTNSITIGHNAKANSGAGSIAIGCGVRSSMVAIGRNINSLSSLSVGINIFAQSSRVFGCNIISNSSIAIGEGMNIGANANMISYDANGIPIGFNKNDYYDANANFPNCRSVAIGYWHNIMANQKYGYNANSAYKPNVEDTIALGIMCNIQSYGAHAIGRSVDIGPCSTDSVAYGHWIHINSAEYSYNANAEDQSSFALGKNANATIAIGLNINMSNGCTRAMAIGGDIRMNNSPGSFVMAPDTNYGYGYDPGSSQIVGGANSIVIGRNNVVNTSKEGVLIFGRNSRVTNNSSGSIYGVGNMYTTNAEVTYTTSGHIHGSGTIIDTISGFIHGDGTINASNYARLYGSGVIKNSSGSVLLGGYTSRINDSYDSLLIHAGTLYGANVINSSGSISIVAGAGSNIMTNSNSSIVIGKNTSTQSSDYSIAIGYKDIIKNSYNATVIGNDIDVNVTSNDVIVMGRNIGLYSNWQNQNDNCYGDILIGRNIQTINSSNLYYLGGRGQLINSTNSICFGHYVDVRNCANIVGYGTYINCENTRYCTIINGKSEANYCLAVDGQVFGSSSLYSVAIGGGQVTNMPNTFALGSDYVSSIRMRVSPTITSDERDKHIVDQINNATEFLSKLHPIRFKDNNRNFYKYTHDDVYNGTITQDRFDEIVKNRSLYEGYGYNKEQHKLYTKERQRIRVGISAQGIIQAMEDVYGDSSYGNIVNDNWHDFTDEERAVIPGDAENKLTVAYENFIPFLIKSIQELNNRISELEGKEG